jgi:hypothetical protein
VFLGYGGGGGIVARVAELEVRSCPEPRFPGQVPSQLALPEILAGDALSLEGVELSVVELGHTDTQNPGSLWATAKAVKPS